MATMEGVLADGAGHVEHGARGCSGSSTTAPSATRRRS